MARTTFVTLTVLVLFGWLAVAWQLVPLDAAPHTATAVAGRFFKEDGGKTVLDRISGLHWQQGFSDTIMTWADAKTWCSTNTPALPGSGWRMPAFNELVSLLDAKTVIDGAFAGTPAEVFWSSTPAPTPGSVWRVYFGGGGEINSVSASYYGYRVRCVR